MSRISEALAGKKNLITFVTGADPDVATSKEIIRAMARAGASLIEIGIPFSDPVAEGPVIQEANERALSNGTTTDDIFDMVKELSGELSIPLVFLTYINPIFTYGIEKFFAKCKECGIEGVIVPDLPYEERDEIEDVANRYGIDRITLIAPTSNERIKMLAKDAKGFIYTVSSMGVTGTRTEFASNIEDVVNQIKSVTDIPVAVGFGIADATSANRMANIAGSAIIGSAIVKIVAKEGKNSPEKVYDFVKDIVDNMNKDYIA